MSEPADPGAPVAAPNPPPPSGDRLSTQAIITYALLVQFTLIGAGIFLLIGFGVRVDPVMLTVLGGFIAAVTNAVSLAIGYWLGSSAGNKTANAALAQIAGAPR